MSVDAFSALSPAAGSLIEVKSGLFVRPVSFDSVGANAATDSSTITPAAGSAVAAPYSPAQIRKAYGFDQLPYDGSGQTIAIIDAFDNPTIASDLTAFSTTFGLPAANFVKAIPNGNSFAPVSTPGGTTPAYNGSWAFEIALDVQWAHAIAPKAKILLVEAASDNSNDLFNAVDYAVAQGASQVSMSFGGAEFNGVSGIDSHFSKPNVSFFASAGDNGAEVEFPAVSPYVVGVGGTTISLDSAGNKLSETTWNGSGGGTSVYVARPSYQAGFQASSKRGVPDIAYNADPSSGVYVILNGSYYSVGGTSAGAPQWAGLAALVNQGRTANGLPTIGTGLAYGLNSALYALAGGTSYTNPSGDFADITTGSNGNVATTGYDTATGLGSPVANKLVPDLIAYGVTSTPTPTPTFAIGDAGFESVSLGSGNFSYNTKGSAWTFLGNSGISENGSAFTSGNPNAPGGQQVAVLQGQGSFTQSVANWAAGSYSLSFQAAQRGNFGGMVQSFDVQIDGVAVGTIRPTSTTYASYSTPAFTVTAGTHSITFVGTGPMTSDNTAFIDTIAVSTAVANPAPAVNDPGFENVPFSAGSFAYNPTGSTWTFANNAGLSSNGSTFTSGNPSAPEGQQVAFIQLDGKISQSVANWTTGKYSLSFLAAQRGNFGTPNQALQIFIDDTLVGTISPIGTSYTTYTTPTFGVTAGTHTITIAGKAGQGVDYTAFIDSVSINQA